MVGLVVFSCTALAPPTDQLGGQCIEALGPQLPVAVEPRVDLPQRFGVHGVQPAGALRANGHETVLTQYPQMLGHGRLGDAELGLHHGAELTRGPLAVREQFEDTTADRIPQDVECVHGSDYIEQRLYKQ